MDASAKARGAAQFSVDDELDEEEGEVIESAPPLQLGEEKTLGGSGIRKKLLKLGAGWETPELGDEATVHYVGTLLDGKIFYSTRDKDEPVTLKIDVAMIPQGLGNCIMTMKRGELALFTLPADLGFVAEGCDNVPPNSVIQYEVELISWISVVDVRKDGGIIKKVVEKGNKDGKPGVLDEVLVSYQVELINGTVVAKSPDEGIEFCVKNGHLCSALPLAIVTMHPGEKVKLIVQPQWVWRRRKRGEKAVLTISPEYGFGNVEVQRDLAEVPKCSSLIYEIEMLDFVKEKKPWEMNNQEKIEAANRKKEEGNLLYKNQKYQRAAKKYDKAADCIENGSFEGDEEKQVKALRVSCFLNGADCSLKLKDFLESIRLCSKVLDIEFENVKALYRRAQSFIETGDLISAEVDIKKDLEADPENREVKSLYRTLKQSKAESNKRDAKLYTSMFAPSKKLKLMEAEEEKIATNLETIEQSNEQSS